MNTGFSAGETICFSRMGSDNDGSTGRAEQSVLKKNGEAKPTTRASHRLIIMEGANMKKTKRPFDTIGQNWYGAVQPEDNLDTSALRGSNSLSKKSKIDRLIWERAKKMAREERISLIEAQDDLTYGLNTIAEERDISIEEAFEYIKWHPMYFYCVLFLRKHHR